MTAGSYERYALILDTEKGELGSVAMQLLESGVDVLYAADVDEGELLARQESSRLGAVLIPSSTSLDDVERVLKQICPQMGAGTQSLVMAGLEPSAEVSRELRDRGAKWCIWEPFEPHELRCVMTAAMATEDRVDPRVDLRIPTDIQANVHMGRHPKPVRVHNISATGAYLATPHPFLEESRLNIEIPLPDGALRCKATVVNAKTDDKPGRPDVPEGMGVMFFEMDGDAECLLRGFIADWISRFWV